MTWVRILIAAALAIVLVDPQVSLADGPPAKQPTAIGRAGAPRRRQRRGRAALAI